MTKLKRSNRKNQSRLLQEEMIRYYKNKNKNLAVRRKSKVKTWVWLMLVLVIFLIIYFYQRIIVFSQELTQYIPQITVLSLMLIIITPIIMTIQLFRSGDKEEFNKGMILILTVIEVFLLFFQSAILQNQNNIQEQQKEILKQTSPAKYASIDPLLSQYIGNTAYFTVSDIKSREDAGASNRVGLNIINTGQLNTGEVQLSQRYANDVFQFETLSIGDIFSKSNKAFWMNFSVSNYSNILGAHKINLTIFCPNCFEQGAHGLMNTEIVLCIFNDTADNFNDVAKRGC